MWGRAAGTRAGWGGGPGPAPATRPRTGRTGSPAPRALLGRYAPAAGPAPALGEVSGQLGDK